MDEPKEAPYTLEELSPEEAAAMTLELRAVLVKYNAEMGVKSAIELLKRVPIKQDATPSPYPLDGKENGEEEATAPAN